MNFFQRPLRQVARLIRINRVLTHYQIDKMVLSHSKYAWLLLLNKLLPWNWRPSSKGSRGERIRLALEELGPIFIKLGQALSTRKDLLPEDIGASCVIARRLPAFENSTPSPSSNAV